MPLQQHSRYFNLSGAHALLMTVNGSAVMAMYTLAQLPLGRALRPCVDLAPLIPQGVCAQGGALGAKLLHLLLHARPVLARCSEMRGSGCCSLLGRSPTPKSIT